MTAIPAHQWPSKRGIRPFYCTETSSLPLSFLIACMHACTCTNSTQRPASPTTATDQPDHQTFHTKQPPNPPLTHTFSMPEEPSTPPTPPHQTLFHTLPNPPKILCPQIPDNVELCPVDRLSAPLLGQLRPQVRVLGLGPRLELELAVAGEGVVCHAKAVFGLSVYHPDQGFQKGESGWEVGREEEEKEEKGRETTHVIYSGAYPTLCSIPLISLFTSSR